MFDADALAGVRVGPPRDVAGREDARRAGLEVLVHGDAAVDRQARLLGQADRRPHADAQDDEVGLERRAVAQRHGASVDARDGSAQMEDDAVLLVELPDEPADLRPHDALERLVLRRDDMDVDAARAQRRRDLEADEARADDHHASSRTRARSTIARLSANVRR